MAVYSHLTWNGEAVLARERAGLVTGLKKATEFVLGESRKVVPLEEGTLERSGTASVDSAELVGAVSYDTPYAVKQHEDLTLRHAPGRTAKYLESPMLEHRGTVQEIIAAEIRRAL